MYSSEKMIPREAAAQSAQNYKTHKFIHAAIHKAVDVIDRNAFEADLPQLDAGRRALAEFHLEWWAERVLPEALEDLARADRQAARDCAQNQAAYYDAALAEALLDGVAISIQR